MSSAHDRSSGPASLPGSPRSAAAARPATAPPEGSRAGGSARAGLGRPDDRRNAARGRTHVRLRDGAARRVAHRGDPRWPLHSGAYPPTARTARRNCCRFPQPRLRASRRGRHEPTLSDTRMQGVPMRGSTFKRCGCRDESGRLLGSRCPHLRSSRHGGWYFAFDAGRDTTGRRRLVRRGGFPTEQAARQALAETARQYGSTAVRGRRTHEPTEDGRDLSARVAQRAGAAAPEQPPCLRVAHRAPPDPSPRRHRTARTARRAHRKKARRDPSRCQAGRPSDRPPCLRHVACGPEQGGPGGTHPRQPVPPCRARVGGRAPRPSAAVDNR